VKAAVPLSVDQTSWEEALAAACAGKGIRSVYQPIVDVERGTTVGFEALTRFDSPLEATPDRWFHEAHRRGCGERLEGVTLASALAARGDLPPGTFLTVNVGPSALASEAVNRVLLDQGDLDGVVLELTEHEHIDDYERLAVLLDRHRSRGAAIAIDDAGAGYSGLQHIVAIRPSLLKLDRSLVCDVHQDDVKRALIEMLLTFARHIGATLLAEGIETAEELATLRSIGVPLVQGFFFALPGAPWPALRDEVRAEYKTKPSRSGATTVRRLLDIAPWASSSATGTPVHELTVVVGEHRSPIGFLDPSRPGVVVDATSVSPDTDIADAAIRAMARPERDRFTPLLCVDGSGRYLGIVRVERLVGALLPNRT
jgi:EAL domain-containing protein (putative c-di-GMP-specific phosphodiesterase class I)